MASCSDSQHVKKSFLCLFIILPHLSWVLSSPLSSRSKRQSCPEGSYEHGTACCLLCAAGEYLEKHCMKKPSDRSCLPCKHLTYNSFPNSKDSCEPCTHCDENANLEEEKPCDSTHDTVCRCRQGYYCNKERCTACQPCMECGNNGIKVACTATNNTVCNDQGSEVNVPAVVLIPLFGLVAAAAVFYSWKKKKCCWRTVEEEPSKVVEREQEMEPLKGVNLSPHIPDIAKVLDWRVMRDLALSTGMTNVAVQNIQQSYPGNVEEQTFQLLNAWVEMKGMRASELLITKLRGMDKNATADQVKAIIGKGVQELPT